MLLLERLEHLLTFGRSRRGIARAGSRLTILSRGRGGSGQCQAKDASEGGAFEVEGHG
jgi:hypothetical protein